MYSHGSYFKSLAEYDLDRLIQQRKNLVQVQSVLSLYDRNNQNLVDQVNQLIQQNQLLKTQLIHPSPRRLKQSTFTHHRSSSYSQVNSNLSISKSTLRKQKGSRYILKLNRPRDIYMAPLQVKMLNRKLNQQARIVKRKYDVARGYDDFKQRLQERKQQLKNSYSKVGGCEKAQHLVMMMKKHPYIEQSSLEINKRLPLQESNRLNTKCSPPETPQLEKKHIETVKLPSPYEDLENSSLSYSPEKVQISATIKKQVNQRSSSSAIKVENIYPSISIKIQQPRTKWEDLSLTYQSKTKFIKNDQNQYPQTQRKQLSGQIEKDKKSKKKKFLNVISRSINEKVISKNKLNE